MVLHAFGVALGDFRAYANGQQKFVDNLVLDATFLSQLLAFVREKNRTVRFGGDVAIALKSCQCFAGSRLRNAHTVGHIDQPGFAIDADQIIDELDIVFDGFVLMRLADTGKTLGLFRHFWQCAIDFPGSAGEGF